MHSVPLGKRKKNASHEDVTLHNVNARMKQQESWETEAPNCSTKHTLYSSCCRDMSSLYHGTWPLDRNIWDAESPALLNMEVSSVMSFASSSGGVPLDQLLSNQDQSRRSSQQLEAKIDMVYNLLSMLGGQEQTDMGETLLALSTSPESCLAMRQSGCLPLLVQLVQSDRDSETRKKAAMALLNLVESQPDEKARKKESKILRLLEIVTVYTEALENNIEFTCDTLPPDGDKHPVQVISQIMKSSFDEGYRQAICQLGGIHTIAKLIETEHFFHGSLTEEPNCNLLRRYACMLLTNLTFGDSGNKALLCSYKDFIRTLLMQLQSHNDELRQVTAGVLRNLSWRADSTSKDILKEVGSVKSLMQAAMMNNKESTLLSILSALWNLSAHCTENKSEICSVDGALVFLIEMLSYKSSSETLAVTENCGGILRNISSQIAKRDDYRNILRKHNCLQILVNHLKSSSSTIVGNACGTLWNLSSQNAIDQELLWKLGAAPLLKLLNKSKHKMIAMGSSATLKNLLTAKADQFFPQVDFVQPLEVRCQANQNELKPIDADLPLDLSRKRPYMKLIEKSHDLKSSSASLNVDESTSAFINDKECQILLDGNSTSLPFVNTTKSGNSSTCIPVISKYSDNYDDELESSEEPFDFSRKYSETRSRENTQKEKSSKATSYDYEKPKNENEKFAIYAETDLDQPTDYSLRYAENDTDSDSEVCENAQKAPAEFVGDTIKTYCTEGTPYETPFNFSTSTSMTDLRLIDKNTSDNDKIAVTKCKTEEMMSVEALCVPVKNSSTETQQPQSSKVKSGLSSGLMSPEKPMNYCDEGTPGYFSRVSSFGSLNSSPVCQNENKISGEIPKENNEVVSLKIDKVQPKISNNEVKVVKFESNVNYCEETPLMFSRSSSLGSLDSIEQHSIHDDRSSVISDFSRLTSGIISPSELPDSPTQTIPPSPKPQKTSEFTITHKASCEGRSQISTSKILPKSHVFEDNITKFKEESTPNQYSMATSLSSLTIDDQDEGQIQGSVKYSKKEDTSTKQDFKIEKKENIPKEESDSSELYGNITRNSILIKTGRQLDLTSASTSKRTSSFHNHTNLSQYNTTCASSLLVLSPKELPPLLPVDNTVQTYYTEDTPAVLSHNGSISDLSLSTLSMLDEEPVENKVYLSENSSNSSEMHENIQRTQSEIFKSEVKANEVWSEKDHVDCPVIKVGEEDIRIPPYTTAIDEVSFFAVEDSPIQFSEISSLSNLTIGSSMGSEVKDVSLTEHKIRMLGREKCPIETSQGEDTEPYLPNDKIFVMNTRLTEKYSENNQESETSHSSMNPIEIQESDSVYEMDDQRISHSMNEQSMLCQNLPLESKYGIISSDSLKKRKWKWKWKFGSDGNEQVNVRENISSVENGSIKKRVVNTSMENEGVKEENSLFMLGSRSLDASYKKKKWWKWKFGAKEIEQCRTVPTDITNYEHLDIVPQNELLTTPSAKLNSFVVEELPNENPFARKEDIFFKSDIYRDNRNKSRRWKWKWKFTSKEGENSKSEELISLGLSKLKNSVSPVIIKEPHKMEDPLFRISLKNQKDLHSTPVELSLREVSESASEPCNRQKCSENESQAQAEKFSKKSSVSSTYCLTVDGVQIEQTENAQVLITNNPADVIGSSRRESLNSHRLNSVQTDESCHGDEIIMSNSTCEADKTESIIPGDITRRKLDFTALIEECIQLGMPRKEEKPKEEIEVYNESHAAPVIRSSSENGRELCNTSFDHMTILENCIQLCMPKRKDEIEYNSEHSRGSVLNIYKESCDMVDPALFDKCVELSRRMQKSKEKIMNKISKALSLDKYTVSVADDEYNTSSVGRVMSEKCFTSPESLRSDKISKDDLEFLRRQLNIADKRLLQDALEKGISKEEEAVLIEIFIMKRVMTEARQYGKQKQNYYNVGLDSSPKFSGWNESDCNKNEMISYSEEPLDPVTLSIVKRILHQKFEKKNGNKIDFPEGIKHYHIDLCDTSTSGNCNFEIFLEERIKMTVAKQETIENNPTVCSNSEDSIISSSSCKINKTPNSTQHRNLISGRICNDNHLSGKDDHILHQKCTQFELLDNTLPENQRANNTSENVSRNDITSNTHRDYAALVEECIKLGMPKKKELCEEILYANISQDHGYSKCNSSTKHETSSITLSEPNEKSASKTNAEPNDAQALVEECIKMSMTKKKETLITKTMYNAKNSIETSENLSTAKLKEEPDYKSLLEECIQLGMPKKKELFSESRSSSPKISSFETNLIGGHSGISTIPSVKRSDQNHISLTEDYTDTELPRTKEDPQEAIYANISAVPGYTRFLQTHDMEAKSLQEGSCNIQQNYSDLINECIKLGMPSRKKIEANIVHGKHNSNEISCNKTPNYEALIEECIQLGMPKKKDISEAIYANTVERYSSNTSPNMDSGFSRFPPIGMIRSDSEPGPNKIPFVSSGNSRSGSALLPYYSSMDKALEECIQLGWPKKKEIVIDRRTDLTAVKDTSRIISVEKSKESESKNVDVASVARNTPEYLRTCFRTLAMATGAEEDIKLQGVLRLTELPKVEEMQLTGQGKSGYKYMKLEYPSEWITESIKVDNETEDGSEMSFADLADVDSKLLDPKAMLEALDKYTAELICQAELRLKLQNSEL